MRTGVVYKVWFEGMKYFLYGSTLHFKTRKSLYLSTLKKGIYSNTFLQNCYNKYPNKFNICIVQGSIPEDILECVEDIWIGANGSLFSDKLGGMNLKNAFRPKMCKEIKDKIKKSKRENICKPILQIDIFTNRVVFEYPCLIDVRENGFDNNSVRGCLLGNNKTAGGFKWRYKEKDEIISIDNNQDKRCKKDSVWKGKYGEFAMASKSIYQIDKITKKIIAEYPSIQNAATINGWKKSSISAALNGHSKSSYGFLWKFKMQNSIKE